MRRRNTSGAYFFHAAVGSLGVKPSINIFAKETCFQGAYLLNNGCTMRGMMKRMGKHTPLALNLPLGDAKKKPF